MTWNPECHSILQDNHIYTHKHTTELLMLGIVCIAINFYGCIPGQTLGLQVEPDPTVLCSNQILIQIRYFAYICITISSFSQRYQVSSKKRYSTCTFQLLLHTTDKRKKNVQKHKLISERQKKSQVLRVKPNHL